LRKKGWSPSKDLSRSRNSFVVNVKSPEGTEKPPGPDPEGTPADQKGELTGEKKKNWRIGGGGELGRKRGERTGSMKTERDGLLKFGSPKRPKVWEG